MSLPKVTITGEELSARLPEWCRRQTDGRVCKNCRFWAKWYQGAAGEASAGECKRHPPVFTGHRWEWPSLLSDDWCGDFEERL